MKFVYMFNEGDDKNKNLLGGKGANLCAMTKLGLNVPQGFVITTDVCREYFHTGLNDIVVNQIEKAVHNLEKQTGKIFGSADNPLLVSVRSGARVSMPGMMNTILNLGLNDEIVKGFAKTSNNSTLAYDCYRRLIQMFGNVVMGIDINLFESELAKIKKESKIVFDKDLKTAQLKKIITAYKKVYKSATKSDFPQDVNQQLLQSVKAVFDSWNNERAKIYRQINGIDENWGTAVNVQRMVFGNMNSASGSGVCFSRSPATGENAFYGEYLMDAQGEDIVAGIRTPNTIESLKQENEDAYTKLYNNALILEGHFKDMQDMEFTIENGILFILQTRNGKRTAKASVKIAVDLVHEKEIDKKTALLRVEPDMLEELLHPVLNINNNTQIAQGLPASPGGASGRIAFSNEKAQEYENNKEDSILVREETSPEDIDAMKIVEGILTARGGVTSHAAVVARGMGKVCVAGLENMQFLKPNKVQIGNQTFEEGDYISIDGSTGKVYGEKISFLRADIFPEFKEFLEWATEASSVKVMANADTSKDAEIANLFGADGIGLCRTEHMFFDKRRILNIQKMILSKTEKQRISALKKLLPYQQEDFVNIFISMQNKPVVIRLLDPPLHEFVPKTEAEVEKLCEEFKLSAEEVYQRINDLKETNSMMGHRGIRLAVSFPEIYEMQATAIFNAQMIVKEKYGIEVTPHIMLPLVNSAEEFMYGKNIIDNVAQKILNRDIYNYKVGTMIETPRAVVISKELAKYADFFSFGTNDLTQFVYGISRDDGEDFLKIYYEKKIFPENIFAHIDENGVGKLIKTAIKNAKQIDENFSLGVCGEHGGDAKSLKFLSKIGLTYVSCSAYRVPVAKLALAQNLIKE